MTQLRFHRINSVSAVKIRQMVMVPLVITPSRKGKTGKINQKLMETATIVMATRMDRRVIILIEITGNTTAKNEITANNIEIIVTAGAVTITGIMTAAGLVATGIIAMAETEVMAITEVVADAKVLVEIFVKTKGVTGIITTTNTEMAAETEVTTEGPPQIIMNPIITGIISIVGVVDDKDFFC